MKITFVLHSHNLSGGNRVISIYADRLQKRGHDVTIVSLGPDVPSMVDFLKILAGRKTIVPPDFTFFQDKPALRNCIVDHPPPLVDEDIPDGDIVIATWWETAEWVAALSPKKGKKVYFIQHHEIHEGQPKDRVIATYTLPLHKITISRWLQTLMVERYQDPGARLIFNSVDTTQFSAPPRSKSTQGTVGMLFSTTTWKGWEVSFQAFQLAAKAFPQLRLMAFGKDPCPPVLARHPYSAYYRNPPQETLCQIYAQCDVWLCGSWTEGFHLPPLEAMACRCPVVSTRVGGPQDIIREGVNGFLSPVGDVAALGANLIKVLSLEPEDWQRLSDEAYQTAIAYSWEDAAGLFEQALEEIWAE